MQKVFLSISFRDEDRQINSKVEQLIVSHNLTPVTGKRAGGQPLRARIFQQIEKSDALVAVMSRREPINGGPAYTTSPWVMDELNHGRDQKINTISLVEEGVQIGGAYTDHERIHFKRETFADTLLALSTTLGLWKYEAGRTVKMLITSPELLSNPRFFTNQMRIEYRYLVEAEMTGWQPINMIREAGSAVVYLPGVQDDHLIQLAVRDGPNQWESDFVHQSIAIELKQIAGG